MLEFSVHSICQKNGTCGTAELTMTDLEEHRSNWDTGKASLWTTVRRGIKMDLWE